jgi:tRNA uridine 5-carboxymethylaminomethyl modification enzyme
VDSTDNYSTLENKQISGLYLAGKLTVRLATKKRPRKGLWAGINAALAVQKRTPMILMRDQAYMWRNGR